MTTPGQRSTSQMIDALRQAVVASTPNARADGVLMVLAADRLTELQEEVERLTAECFRLEIELRDRPPSA